MNSLRADSLGKPIVRRSLVNVKSNWIQDSWDSCGVLSQFDSLLFLTVRWASYDALCKLINGFGGQLRELCSQSNLCDCALWHFRLGPFFSLSYSLKDSIRSTESYFSQVPFTNIFSLLLPISSRVSIVRSADLFAHIFAGLCNSLPGSQSWVKESRINLLVKKRPHFDPVRAQQTVICSHFFI